MRRAFASVLSLLAATACGADAPDFSKDVQPIFTKYCAGCHNTDDANGEFVLDDFESLMKGGQNGAVLVPGKADASLLIKLVERTAEPAMPPEEEPAPSRKEIAILKAWIEAGAKGPTGDGTPLLSVPKIEPTGPVRRPVYAAAWSPDAEFLAVGRYREVELLGRDRAPLSTIDGLMGKVNVVAFLPEGRLVAAGGVSGLGGEIGVWDILTGEVIWKKSIHRDAVTAGAVSPDGRLIATGSYDQTISVWDAATGEPKATLTGHNSAVFGLAFHPNKPILASASGDRTIKLWATGSGARLDTLTEPTAEQSDIAFSPDGTRLYAGGADNRLRVWSVDSGQAGTTKILISHFAHEAPIVALASSPDGRVIVTASEDATVKFWEANALAQVAAPAAQSDWVAALAISPEGRQIALGTLGGSLELVPLPQAPDSSSSRNTATATQRAPVAAAKPSVAPAATPMPDSVAEAEPNDLPETASTLTLPGVVTGLLNPAEGSSTDADCFRFTVAAGETWIFDTNAARSGSPADTKVDVLHLDGTLVERLRLRAVRDSAINFRPMDAVKPTLRADYWEEMELNEYMYLSGEVGRIFRMPRGPDSDMLLYAVDGRRRTYFDTTPVAHALFEPVYIVEPHPPGTEWPANGLPIFTLPFENDDASEQSFGRDSQLQFTAAAGGDYVVRVRDTRRFGGPDYKYTLTARRPMPDFNVSIVEKDRTIPAGSGQKLTLKVDRTDGFEGPVQIAFANLPDGLSVASPVVIEAGHTEAQSVINASPDAAAATDEAWKAASATATAPVAGRSVTKSVTLPARIVVGEKPKMTVTLLPESESNEIVIRPGQRVRAMLRLNRDGYDDQLNIDLENLPHGVIVDHIGLNGVLIRKGETERQIEFHCADWVEPTQRLIFGVGRGQGDQASNSVLLRVAAEDDDALVRIGE